MYQLVNVSLRVTIHSIPRSPLPTDAADPGEPDQDRVDFRLTPSPRRSFHDKTVQLCTNNIKQTSPEHVHISYDDKMNDLIIYIRYSAS